MAYWSFTGLPQLHHLDANSHELLVATSTICSSPSPPLLTCSTSTYAPPMPSSPPPPPLSIPSWPQFLSATCHSLQSAAAHSFSFLPSLHLVKIAVLLKLLCPLLPSKLHLRLGYRCLTTVPLLAWLSLHDLCLFNCDNSADRSSLRLRPSALTTLRCMLLTVVRAHVKHSAACDLFDWMVQIRAISCLFGQLVINRTD